MASPRRRPPPAPPHHYSPTLTHEPTDIQVTTVPVQIATPPPLVSPPQVASPPKYVKVTPKTVSPPKVSPPKVTTPPKFVSPPTFVKVSPKTVSPPKVSPPKAVSPPPSPPPVLSPPSVVSPPKPIRVDSRLSSETNASPFVPAVDTNGIPMEVDLPPPDLLEATEESNGVGDKIKIFEKAAEDAATAGRLSRPGSVRRPRTERLPSDELPPPPTVSPPRIVRPEFRLASPAEVTIRSPSLGAKAPERFPSRGTAFRNVTPAPPPIEEDHKKKDRQTRGSNYFTRGSEEIWLVKKKDIEEIEERVLDSFRRAANSTRGKRGYARSESLEPARPEWKAQLKRQASVACTCGHDKKARAKSVDAIRPRARSQSGEEPTSVLDKYETLV